jgi:hypothetical protein
LMLERDLAVVTSIACGPAIFGCNQSEPIMHEKPRVKDRKELGALPMPTQSPRHQGKWQAVNAILDGVPFPDAVTEGITLSINGSEYSVRVAGRSRQRHL